MPTRTLPVEYVIIPSEENSVVAGDTAIKRQRSVRDGK